MKSQPIDLATIRKYDVSAPRYTSYPPATQFSTKVDSETVLSRVAAHQKDAGEISLYFHLPFCRSLCWYCGCANVITSDHTAAQKYISYLDREIKLIKPTLDPRRHVVQIHLGGGTPTYFQPEEIRELSHLIRHHFQVSPKVEAGVEIDPRTLSLGHVSALKDGGFRRVSLGVQDFDPEVQAAIHRAQPREFTEHAVKLFRDAGFTSVNFDLIYGLPRQTPATFGKTLDAVIKMDPDRLAIFGYAHVPWLKPAQRLLTELPTPKARLTLLKLAVEKLADAGYICIGMDHFAKAHDPLAKAQVAGTLHRNFQGYTTFPDADIHGFGMSSISQADGTYWQNDKDLDGYYKALDAGRLPVERGYVLKPEDKIRRTTIVRLMCDMKLDFGAMSEMLGICFADHFAKEIRNLHDLVEDGLLTVTTDGLEVTPVGRLLVRNIAMRFDATRPASGHAPKTRQFSKTI
jgi:oxygen-independent coproporphyrinogen-3 oxidase